MDVNKKYKAAVQCSTEDMIAQKPLELKVNAVLSGQRIECGACRALLAKRLSPHGIHDFNGESATEFMRSQEPRFVKKVQSEPNTIEIKCKHRSKGIACDYVNVISL